MDHKGPSRLRLCWRRGASRLRQAVLGSKEQSNKDRGLVG
jgi:hypothetical protein